MNRKVFSYIALVIAIGVFIYAYIQTGSFTFSITIAGIGVAWFLFENIFDILAAFGVKSKDKKEDKHYQKAKKDLEKVTDNNPTLR